jgi:hypothetical protein
VRGPTSRPIWSSGSVDRDGGRLHVGAELRRADDVERQHDALPASASSRRQVSTWSASSSDVPTPWPCAARKVKHMPPPTSSRSTLGSSASMTASLSLTFDPPSTTT